MTKQENKTTKNVANENVNEVKNQATAQVDNTQVAAAALPVAANTDNGKVSSKDVLKAAGSLRATVTEERRGANVTIRLIAERAAAGVSYKDFTSNHNLYHINV